jgi:voltage-gated potassium channel
LPTPADAPAEPRRAPVEERRPRQKLVNLMRLVRQLLASLRRENAHVLLLTTMVTTMGAAVLEYLVEFHGRNLDIGDAMWWAIVTLTTVGYGDVYPQTGPGRLVGITLMAFGVVMLSLVTASIASVLVERRIREDRGLEGLNLTGHTVLCGWNDNAEDVVSGLTRAHEGQAKVALVNDLDEDQVNGLRFRYKDFGEFRFVRGDFTNETVLKMANIEDADSCIILADLSATGLAKSDERVILAVLTIKAMATHVRVCVEALDKSNVTHLRRAKADEVIVRGRYTGFFLVNAVAEPGVGRAVEELLSFDLGNLVRRRAIPERMVGKTVLELAQLLREAENSILIGVVSEAPGVDVQSILSGDMSAIDLFIKRKFEEAGQDLSQAARREDVMLNPPNDRVIDQYDVAIVVPSLAGDGSK